MSELKRYNIYKYTSDIVEQPNSQGLFIRYSDYEKLKEQLEKCEGALKFYADEMNYSIDDYHGISGEMITRCVLYKDLEERNDFCSYAGRRAREYFKEKEQV